MDCEHKCNLEGALLRVVSGKRVESCRVWSIKTAAIRFFGSKRQLDDNAWAFSSVYMTVSLTSRIAVDSCDFKFRKSCEDLQEVCERFRLKWISLYLYESYGNEIYTSKYLAFTVVILPVYSLARIKLCRVYNNFRGWLFVPFFLDFFIRLQSKNGTGVEILRNDGFHWTKALTLIYCYP